MYIAKIYLTTTDAVLNKTTGEVEDYSGAIIEHGLQERYQAHTLEALKELLENKFEPFSSDSWSSDEAFLTYMCEGVPMYDDQPKHFREDWAILIVEVRETDISPDSLGWVQS